MPRLVCIYIWCYLCFFFFQAEDGIRDLVTGVQTCALPILPADRSNGCALASAFALGGTSGMSPFLRSAVWICGLRVRPSIAAARSGLGEWVGIDQPSPGPPVTTGGAQKPAVLWSALHTAPAYQLPSMKKAAFPWSNMFRASSAERPWNDFAKYPAFVHC